MNKKNFAKLLDQYGMTNINQAITEKELGEQEIKTRKNSKIKTVQNTQAILDLHSQTQNEAMINLEDFIVDCSEKNLSKILIITGKGKGIIRQATKEALEELKQNKNIKKYKTAPPNKGGDGAFIVYI